ncbi:MAG: hypothetical protein FWC73_14100 [Defluviitaleaceae bacterium]|nr:hypothetical protein [Defluviitaleaceae bacterium]
MDNTGIVFSATGANPAIPEMTPKAQARHIHHIGEGRDFPSVTLDEYVKAGADFARMPVGGDIEGYRGVDGCIVRYNNTTGEWVKAYSTGVASYMRPKAGRIYYVKWLELDGGIIDDG